MLGTKKNEKKYMAVKCGFEAGSQGVFFLGDACRDAHPDMGMGVNDAALQARGTCAAGAPRPVLDSSWLRSGN